jgi:hypothetical protein
MPARRSPELDQVRQLLFPSLSPEEGWARIDQALEGAQDDERLDRIEDLAEGDLIAALVLRIRRNRP